MVNVDVSDYSELTAGQHEGRVLKRESNYKWQPYWCVLYGRLLTFYEDSEKRRVAGRIEIQPGSTCEKAQPDTKIPSVAELFHRDHSKLKKYSLKLRTKRGTHLFTYENVNDQTRWQMAMNNASQIDANGVRLSWVPTPFTLMSSAQAVESKRQSLNRTQTNSNSNEGIEVEDCRVTIVDRSMPRAKTKSKHDDTHSLITECETETTAHAYTNDSLQTEMVTAL